jgi:membrane-bound lytic murein transglycosylase B
MVRSRLTWRRAAAVAIVGSLALGAGAHVATAEASPPPFDMGAALSALWQQFAAVGSGPTTVVPVIGLAAAGDHDVPAVVSGALERAVAGTSATQPGCHLGWPLLAAISQVESRHGRYRGAVVDAAGTVSPTIYGPLLDGTKGARVADTDQGSLDGDPNVDRAVGPMQFIPSTWEQWKADGNGDGLADPNNYYDAALAAARYLCARNIALASPDGLRTAVRRYGGSQAYVDAVLGQAARYAQVRP